MLNERQQKLIALLKEEKNWIKGKSLSALFHVSDRTIRSDIEKINRERKDLILSSLQKGYRICEREEGKESNSKELPQTSSQRCRYILQQLLFSKQSIFLPALLKELYVSEFTLENDLKKVKKTLENTGLRLHRVHNTISLEGEEQEKRRLYKHLLEEETKGNFLNLSTLSSLFYNFDLFQVKKLLEASLQSCDIQLRETVFPMVILHVGVALERMMKGNYVYRQTEDRNLRQRAEYRASSCFYEKIKQKFHIEVNHEEIIILTYLLMGKKNFEETENKDETLEAQHLVNDILLLLKKNYDVDFRMDEELQVGLTLHIRSLLQRARSSGQSFNVFLPEIKKKFPLVFDMAVQVCNLLSDALHVEIDENEIGFIALHLGTAYERSNIVKKHKAILIVAHEEAFLSACRDRILHKFSERLEFVYCASMLDEGEIQKRGGDLLLITSELRHSLPIATVHISIFVNQEDESMIFQALNRLDKQRFHMSASKQIRDIINPAYFYCFDEFQSPEDLISFMCDRLYQDGQVDRDFKASVLKREAMSATSFFYSFATPHALYCQALHSNISVMLLKKPLQWGDFQVKLVLLLAIRDRDKMILKLVFDWLSQAIRDVENFQKILSAETYEDFIKGFLEFHY